MFPGLYCLPLWITLRLALSMILPILSSGSGSCCDSDRHHAPKELIHQMSYMPVSTELSYTPACSIRHATYVSSMRHSHLSLACSCH